ncbi:hypothetical protein F4803DRAFT_21311 [Xylaria telfairii]|nr:hypothetical protein F4803DRAFT_21311 [Xylaria telfairii]
MSANTASKKYPQLPTELYLCIIEVITDSSYLPRVWLNFHRVSREFKAITESVFIRQHLPHACIEFPAMFGYVYDKDDKEHLVELSLYFEKLAGNNNERAVFHQERDDFRQPTRIFFDSYSDTLSGYITRRWREIFYEYSLPAPKTAFSNALMF